MPETEENESPYVPSDQDKFDEMIAAFERLPLGMARVHLAGQFIARTDRGGNGYDPKDTMHACNLARATTPAAPDEPTRETRAAPSPGKTILEQILESLPKSARIKR